MLRKFCDAYRHGDRSERLAVVYHRQLAQSGADSFRAGLSCFQVGDREDNNEFFAAEAAHNVLGANTLQKERSRLAKHGIARIMPISVVEFFEVVQISIMTPKPCSARTARLVSLSIISSR